MGRCDLGARGLPLRSLGHAVRTNALGAHADPLEIAVDESTDALEIRIPAPIGFIVRVAHMVTEHRSLATDFTNPSHGLSAAVRSTNFAKP